MAAVATVPDEGSSASAPASPTPVPPGIWMVGPAFDLLFFVGTALVVLGPWWAIEKLHVKPFLVVAAVAITANGPHLVSTWTRVYLDGNERWRRPIAYWVVPALIAATVVYFIVFKEGRRSSTLRTVLFYWAWWHFVAQNWGILRIYQRRAGEQDRFVLNLERVVLYLGALWPILHRLYKGPWVLFGAHIRHPDLSPPIVNGAGALLAVAASLYVIVRITHLARGRKVDVIRPLFILASCFGFFVPFVLIRNSGSAAFAAAACWHGLQYLGIVWFFNRSRWRTGVDRKATLVSWVSQPGRWPLYFLMLLGLAGIVYGGLNVAAMLIWTPETWGAMVWLSLTFGHYWLDGVIWKLRKPELSKHLVTAPALSPTPAATQSP